MASTSNLYPSLSTSELETQSYRPASTESTRLTNNTNTHVSIARTTAVSNISTTTVASEDTPMTLSANPPIPLSTYISMSHIAISSALKVAMVSTSMTLGIARTIVTGLDKVLGGAVKTVTKQNEDALMSPSFVASLPFRAALLGINFSDILIQTILETVDGSVNLALSTIQDGVELMDTLFGADSTSQTGETFREVWAILSRELKQTNNGQAYPLMEGLRLFMAYIAIQFATSEVWETARINAHCRLVGECLESKDEVHGSSTAWSALAAWPEEWTKGHYGMTADELLQEQRIWELREQREGRSAASFSAFAPGRASASPNRGRSTTPNVELTNFLAASYRFSRFCSAMYGSTFLEILGSPERFPPPPPIPTSTAPSAPPEPGTVPHVDASEHHFHCYTGTPLGSILYSSDNPATIQDGYYSPRYYLLDDVETKQIVLVLRGTKSLHDLMIDLTCDAADLWLDHDTTPLVDAQGNVVNDPQRKKRPFRVHGGFLKAARTIASAETIGIQEKVKAALEARPGYSLLLIGHSLGAGIASILATLWADPATGLTPETPSHISTGTSVLPVGPGVSVDDEERGKLYLPGFLPKTSAESFLPPGRRVRCYGYGSPRVMCPRMSKRALKLVTSISYGDDAVGRLSLGSVRSIMHSMRALVAIRPPSSPSPPSPPESPRTETSPEVIHDASETLGDLLEGEGEGINPSSEKKKKQKTPTQKSIGLEIVQKVIRWRLTKEDQLLEEFLDIRRAMHREVHKYQERYELGDFYLDGEEPIDQSKISTVLVPPGKVLWIRPTTWEKELENAETKQHPLTSVIHQFEWDHPIKHDAASLLIPKPFSEQLHQHLEEDEADSASIRSLKSTVRSSLYPVPETTATSPNLSSSPPTTTRMSRSSSQAQSHQLQRRDSIDSIASTASPASLHPDSQNTEKLLYQMYAVPEPEHVFDEMLFSRRMWSDHLPLTYEFILAGKHAIPVSSQAAATKTAGGVSTV